MKQSGSTIRLRVPSVGGDFKIDVHVPDGDLRLADLVPLAQRITSTNVDRAVTADKREGHKVSCKKGCGACCRQLAPVSAPEAFRLADFVLALPAARRDAFLARIDAVDSAVEAAGLMQELEAMARGVMPAKQDEFARRYFAQRIPCPFLHEESCSVHEERPMICRSYLVTSPAELCSLEARPGLRTIPMPPSLSPALSRAAARLSSEAAAVIPLSIAMRWVDQHAELGQREWPARELMDALITELTAPTL